VQKQQFPTQQFPIQATPNLAHPNQETHPDQDLQQISILRQLINLIKLSASLFSLLTKSY